MSATRESFALFSRAAALRSQVGSGRGSAANTEATRGWAGFRGPAHPIKTVHGGGAMAGDRASAGERCPRLSPGTTPIDCVSLHLHAPIYALLESRWVRSAALVARQALGKARPFGWRAPIGGGLRGEARR